MQSAKKSDAYNYNQRRGKQIWFISIAQAAKHSKIKSHGLDSTWRYH